MPWGEAAKVEKDLDNEGGVYSQTKDFVGGLNPLFQLGLTVLTTAGVATGVIAGKRKVVG